MPIPSRHSGHSQKQPTASVQCNSHNSANGHWLDLFLSQIVYWAQFHAHVCIRQCSVSRKAPCGAFSYTRKFSSWGREHTSSDVWLVP